MKLELSPVKIQVEHLGEEKQKESWKRTSLEDSSATLASLLQKIDFTHLPRLEEIKSVEDQKKYLVDAFKLFRSAVFLSEIDGLVRDQKDYIVENAESEAQLMYGRGIIYGLTALRLRIEELHNKYLQEQEEIVEREL